MSADITPELLAEIKRLDDEGRNGGPEFNEIAATALPALAREYEIERALSLTRQKALAEATERYTAAEQQRDEMAKALEQTPENIDRVAAAMYENADRKRRWPFGTFPSLDAHFRKMARAALASLQPKGTTS